MLLSLTGKLTNVSNNSNVVFFYCFLTNSFKRDADVLRTYGLACPRHCTLEEKSTQEEDSKLTCTADWQTSLPDKCAFTGSEGRNKQK